MGYRENSSMAMRSAAVAGILLVGICAVLHAQAAAKNELPEQVVKQIELIGAWYGHFVTYDLRISENDHHYDSLGDTEFIPANRAARGRPIEMDFDKLMI